MMLPHLHTGSQQPQRQCHLQFKVRFDWDLSSVSALLFG
jgi:hypothetical protein